MKKCVRTAICGGPEELEDVMTNDDYIVGITLEDYSVPRSKNAVALYCGTVYELGFFWTQCMRRTGCGNGILKCL